MKTLNLGILAHVDAGKTSLTERLLLHAGVIDEAGSVDDGTTRTDNLALERRRGITIKSAVVSFAIGDVMVNLIDTPGHPDFIAEVERALSVLDGAVLVISAVEGVQPQTRVLMRALQRLRIPCLLFVNKIDRSGAQAGSLLESISEKLTPVFIVMGSARTLGSCRASFAPYGPADPGFRAQLADVLTRHDDALLGAYVEDETALSCRRLRHTLAAQTGQSLVHPVFFGSARTGAGVDALAAGIAELLPPAAGDPGGPVSGTVFKVERGPSGDRIAYVRMFSGTARTRDRISYRPGKSGKITALRVFGDSAAGGACVSAGQIAKVWGLDDIQIGDKLGTPLNATAAGRFPPPTLESVIVPSRPAEKAALHAALTQLVEQDPLINLRQDDERNEISVSLYGEVQKEVLQATLAEEFGVEVTFRKTTTIHIERPAGAGSAVEFIDVPPNPFLATVGLRVEPAAPGSGVAFRLAVEPGSMPAAFFTAVEETVSQTLQQGLSGWQVTDCAVTMTHSGYWARQSHAHGSFDKTMSSTAGDFRNLTPLVLMTALQQAGTRVCEPICRFRLETPPAALPVLLPVLARLRASIRAQHLRGRSCLLEGDIPAAQARDLERRLPTLTHGEGVLESVFGHYRPVTGPPPSRPRSGLNPVSRKEHLLRVAKGLAARRDGW